MVSFYTDFAAAYGTLWLIMFACALVTQSHINTGVFGLLGFPVIALIYAFIRRPGRKRVQQEREEYLRQNRRFREMAAQKRLEAHRHPRATDDIDDIDNGITPPDCEPTE